MLADQLAGAAGGGLLGQLGDVLSAPRRALWSGLAGIAGADTPQSGADLVHMLTGIHPDSVLGKGLGFGAEVLGDPLTYAGGGLGRLLGTGARALTGARAAAPLADAASIAARAQGLAPAALKQQQTLEALLSQYR